LVIALLIALLIALHGFIALALLIAFGAWVGVDGLRLLGWEVAQLSVDPHGHG
jgi:hypothetical protein